MKKLILFVFFTALFSVSIFADEALPPTTKKTKPIKARLEIVVDSQADTPRLQIPRELVAGLADGNGRAVGSISKSQTIAGGLFMSLAFIFGGLWLVRRRKAVATKRNGIAAAAVLLFATGIVFSNAAPPLFQKIDSKIFSEEMKSEGYAFGDVKVVVSDNEYDKSIRLYVPQEKKGAETKTKGAAPDGNETKGR